MENLNAEQVKSDLEKFTKSFECCHQGYVEACGLICKVRKEIIFDLANHRHSECNEDCKDYEPFPDLQAMRNALALINKQETEYNELYEICESYRTDLHATRTELTRVQEDNEYLKTQVTATEARYESRKESDLEEVLELRLKVEELTEENERVKLDVEVCGAELSRYTENIVQMAKQDRADTVRKMQERLKAECNKYLLHSTITIMLHHHIDKIAKEMLEGADNG